MNRITITTYTELHDFIAAFGADGINMMVVCSRGGLGKSEEAAHALAGAEVVRIGGHVTALKLYELLYNGRDQKIVFNEIDELLGDKTKVGMMKDLCETRDVKRVTWSSSDRRAAEIDGGVGHFATRSHVLMLCNSFTVLSANLKALQTRATIVFFEPPSEEILARIMTFATDDKVVAFLQEFHRAIPDFSLRTYVKLAELNKAGLAWRKYAMNESSVSPKVLEISDLLRRYPTDIERVQHYSGCRRDYYSWKPKAVEHCVRLHTISAGQSDVSPLAWPDDRAR